jgi:hypothetical protein
VTSLSFEPLAAPRMSNFHLAWSHSEAAAAIAAWQAWSPCGPDELSADLSLSVPADETTEPTVEMFGALIGTTDEVADLLESLVERVGRMPSTQRCGELSYGDSCAFQADVSVSYDQVEPRPRQGYRLTKSQYFAQPLPHDVITSLMETLTEQRRSVLPRPRARRLGKRLLRRQLPAPRRDQEGVRPRGRLPLQPVNPGLLITPVARRRGTLSYSSSKM